MNPIRKLFALRSLFGILRPALSRRVQQTPPLVPQEPTIVPSWATEFVERQDQQEALSHFEETLRIDAPDGDSYLTDLQDGAAEMEHTPAPEAEPFDMVESLDKMLDAAKRLGYIADYTITRNAE